MVFQILSQCMTVFLAKVITELHFFVWAIGTFLSILSIKLLAIWNFRDNAAFLFCHRALEDSKYCAHKNERKQDYETIHVTVKGNVTKKKKSVSNFSFCETLNDLYLIQKSKLFQIATLFFSSHETEGNLHPSKQKAESRERINWQKIRLSLGEL